MRFNLWELHFHGRADYISHKYSYVKYNNEDVEDYYNSQEKILSFEVVNNNQFEAHSIL